MHHHQVWLQIREPAPPHPSCHSISIFSPFCAAKESLSRAPSRSSASRHSPDIRDKLVCHSLVIFTIRLKLPGPRQSHQNPIQEEKKPYTQKNIRARSTELELKNRVFFLNMVDGGLCTQEKIVFYLFPFFPPHFIFALCSKEQLCGFWSLSVFAVCVCVRQD